LERAVSRVLPRSLQADRDDIVQQALLRALREVERGGDPGPGYLRKAAWSATIDELRRRRSSRLELVDAVSEPVDPEPDPLAALSDQRLGEAIRGCLAVVADTRRPALTLWTGTSAGDRGRSVKWNLPGAVESTACGARLSTPRAARRCHGHLPGPCQLITG
jgi:hypothetical protein